MLDKVTVTKLRDGILRDAQRDFAAAGLYSKRVIMSWLIGQFEYLPEADQLPASSDKPTTFTIEEVEAIAKYCVEHTPIVWSDEDQCYIREDFNKQGQFNMAITELKINQLLGEKNE